MSIADDMMMGICCEMCGEFLMCKECERIGVPAYCSDSCAEDRGASADQACRHKGNGGEISKGQEKIMDDIKELVEALGFAFQFEQPRERKMRFKNDTTFVDVWAGKRGITLGIYDPETKKVLYHRRLNLAGLERQITLI